MEYDDIVQQVIEFLAIIFKFLGLELAIVHLLADELLRVQVQGI